MTSIAEPFHRVKQNKKQPKLLEQYDMQSPFYVQEADEDQVHVTFPCVYPACLHCHPQDIVWESYFLSGSVAPDWLGSFSPSVVNESTNFTRYGVGESICFHKVCCPNLRPTGVPLKGDAVLSGWWHFFLQLICQVKAFSHLILVPKKELWLWSNEGGMISETRRSKYQMKVHSQSWN